MCECRFSKILMKIDEKVENYYKFFSLNIDKLKSMGYYKAVTKKQVSPMV